MLPTPFLAFRYPLHAAKVICKAINSLNFIIGWYEMSLLQYEMISFVTSTMSGKDTKLRANFQIRIYSHAFNLILIKTEIEFHTSK